MKSKLSLPICLTIAVLLGSCQDTCEGTHTAVYYEPVYGTTTNVRNDFGVRSATSLRQTGKIYLYGSYLFINEPGKGVHIIDNQDKTAPINVSFINIPGNFDIAVKDNVLYADSYIDLLAIDISNIDNIALLSRREGVFRNYCEATFDYNEAQNTIIVDWEEIKTTETYSYDCSGFWSGGVLWAANSFDNTSSPAIAAEAAAPQSQTGVGGSFARFAIYTDYLYTVDIANMSVFDISDISSPVNINVIGIGRDIETIFPYQDKLFIGAQDGMHIFDNSTPNSPVYLSTFQHARACDPVVVSGNYAYVTLRSGNTCDGFTNQLDIVDITDLTNPQLLESHPMQNPHGLGIDQNTLFLCEGYFGLKIFDAYDPLAIDQNLINHFTDQHAFDVIPLENNLIMIGDDGLYQYDYTDLGDISLQSVIPVVR